LVFALRIYGLDVFRGWAILLMIIFHFFYDLNYFHYIHINLLHDTFWRYFRFLIVSIFLLSVGMSLALTHSPKICWRKMWKRTFTLGMASFLVTLATYFVFPHAWVYFGVLHFILLASWVGLLFLYYPIFSIFLGIVILIAYNLGLLYLHGLFNILQHPLHLPPHFTVDLVSFFPWFAFVLFGITIVKLHWHYKIFTHSFFSQIYRFNQLLALMGKHTLFIYLAHLPILFGLFMLFT